MGSRRSVGLFFLLASFLPAVLCLLVGHQGSLLRDGIKKDGGGGFGLVWLGDININIISYCAVVSYIGFTWLWFFFFSFFSLLFGHLSSLFSSIFVYRPRPFCLNLERGSRALRGTGRTGIRAQDGRRGWALGWSPGQRRRPVWVSWLCGLVSGRCVCRDMTPLASCRTDESGGAYGALYEEAFGSDSALSPPSVLQLS